MFVHAAEVIDRYWKSRIEFQGHQSHVQLKSLEANVSDDMSAVNSTVNSTSDLSMGNASAMEERGIEDIVPFDDALFAAKISVCPHHFVAHQNASHLATWSSVSSRITWAITVKSGPWARGVFFCHVIDFCVVFCSVLPADFLAIVLQNNLQKYGSEAWRPAQSLLRDPGARKNYVPKSIFVRDLIATDGKENNQLLLNPD
ncbi:hypothetical protein DAPPUDRAFT_253796 [Daphnia pulex]|uniref:Uncharacterized protein n=1 Tax=Daphnia pulex TaxID=6669 RepID=E9H5F5_DAPPU|nr:hypothetical protein DAPPUDRAFT_253796 [Daphnia pulex]|eukprot:EFX73013.1 hypothetical protein DAPPUDRAFT_253796 [Daphnia pulex]